MSKKSHTAARIAAGIGLALGGTAIAAGALYTEIMTSIIARRRTPATDAMVALATGYEPAPPDPAIAAMTQALQDAPTRLVELRSRDGFVLRAHWYPTEGAKRTVMLVHGWHSRWCVDFSASAPFLREAGCNLLLIDQRCHGESGGDLIAYGIAERYDVVTWLDWLEQEPEHKGLPVYLCGVSMGAATVLMAAGLPISGRVCGIIADCGYSTPDEIIKLTLEKNIGKMAGPTLAAVNINCKLRENFTFKDYSPLEAMVQNKDIPCLFVHGDADDFVPWRMSFENFYACRAPKDILIVNGAGHGLSFLVNPEIYKKKLLSFFETYDPISAEPMPEPKKCLFGKKKAAL